MPKRYWRPIIADPFSDKNQGLALAGGGAKFSTCERISRDEVSEIVSISKIPDDVLESLTKPRADIAGQSLSDPKVMGILNVTPDSFSDGGENEGFEAAVQSSIKMKKEGADIIDIGGESTRPGADFVKSDQEMERTIPVIKHLIASQFSALISIDTRKADVAQAALKEGAVLFNDVTALSFDPDSLEVAKSSDAYVCLMHASGDPKTMQLNPVYDNVVLDVYDYLRKRRNTAIDAGIAPERIILDPGIGFGKTTEHNIALIQGLSTFHGLGCPILLGASRKRLIGELTGEMDAQNRLGGSLAIALEGIRQGVQIVRVHDVAQTKQAMTMWGHIRG